MHINLDELPEDYKKYTFRKTLIIIFSFLLFIIVFIFSISIGAVRIPLMDVIKTLFLNAPTNKTNLIIWNIRLPQAFTAVIAGIGLAVSGLAMQTILNNPLGSPLTLGFQHAAAFGAAFSVMVLGTGVIQSTGNNAISIVNHYITTLVAFGFCMLTSGVILITSKIKKTSPEVMVLTGIALGTLFLAGTMFLQYFADDVQLAAMVFWTFGDVARATWKELLIILVIIIISLFYFFYNIWNYNTMQSGDETAKSLGVNVELIRLITMIIATLVTSVIVSFLGVIGFIGLVCPHMARKIIGEDHRFLVPFTCILGGILLLAADTAARIILLPHVLPVAILTSFLGAPVFIFLLIKGYK